MTRAVHLRPEAEADLAEAFRWFQDRGTGAEFLRAVDDVLARVRELPTMYPVVHRDVRRALIARFHYGLFYLVETERITVLAVMHQARDPSRWQKRV